MSSYTWSDWLDFKKEIIQKIPRTMGVFMTHQAMKILFIGDSENLQKSLLETLESLCTCDSSRFRYAEVNKPDIIKEELISDYKKRHDGNLPKCM